MTTAHRSEHKRQLFLYDEADEPIEDDKESFRISSFLRIAGNATVSFK